MTKINVSTRAAVIHYLRSIHVSTKHVVIQRGLRNYAGAHCPGKGWTCAGTRHTVVQIAKRGGLNRFACTTAKCAVVQLAGAHRARLRAAPKPPPPPNTALCAKTTGITGSCVINQPNASGTNQALVWMVTPKNTGLTQSGAYSASITQGPASATGSSNNNVACVRQFVWIDGSTTKTNTAGTTVTNDNHELITINQNSLTGNNTVQGAKTTTSANAYACDPTQPLMQDELLTSVVNSKGSITQKQDTLPSTTSCTKPPDAAGCANVVTDIEQNQGSGFKGFATGLNYANFKQTTNQIAIANTPNGTVSQTQNANVPLAPYSGIVGTINQDSTHLSTAVVTQDEKQCQDAVSVPTIPAPTAITGPGSAACPATGGTGVPSGVTLTQTQWGPVSVLTPSKSNSGPIRAYHKGYGQSEQTGAGVGVVDSFKLTQTSTQSADQTSGQHNTMQGDCKSSGDGSDTGGSCDASQSATLNGAAPTDGYTAGSIVKLIIQCATGNSCTATPPPTPVLTTTPTDPSEDTNPTFEWTEGGTGATNGISFECSIDSGDPVSCDSGDAFPVGLGPHTFDVTASDNFGHTSDAASFGPWTVVPYLTFEWTDDGAAAGWKDGVAGSSIDLTVGSNSGTYGQFTLHNFEGIAISDLTAEPTFTTDTFLGGAPRYEIDLDNGDYLFGYPSNAPYGQSWDVNCGHVGCVPRAQVPWSQVQSDEGSAAITDVLVEADFPPGVSATYNISDFNFDTYTLSFFGDHFH